MLNIHSKLHELPDKQAQVCPIQGFDEQDMALRTEVDNATYAEHRGSPPEELRWSKRLQANV